MAWPVLFRDIVHIDPSVATDASSRRRRRVGLITIDSARRTDDFQNIRFLLSANRRKNALHRTSGRKGGAGNVHRQQRRFCQRSSADLSNAKTRRNLSMNNEAIDCVTPDTAGTHPKDSRTGQLGDVRAHRADKGAPESRRIDNERRVLVIETIPSTAIAEAPLARTSGFGRIRSIVGGSIGNAVEYFDWYVYSAFSLYFAPIFFPQANPTAQLLGAAAIFAVGFFMRPIGAWLLGTYADRKGRRAALMVSVVAMCVGSLIIGVLPGYTTIGLAAPALLVAARLLQGLSLGGEYASSATYLSETASASTRGFYSSFLFATLSLGQLLALGVLVVLQQFVLTDEQLHEWGWRIPFFLGAVLAVAAIWMRSTMSETEAFSKGKKDPTKRGVSMRLLLQHWRECLQVAGLTLGGTVSFYAFTTYSQKFLVNSGSLDKSQATLACTIGLMAFIAMQPVFGALSDRVGRRPLLIAFGLLGSACTIPLFHELGAASSVGSALVPMVAALAIVSMYSSVSAIAKAELFPVEIRALGVGLPYSLTVSVFGGTAEYVALSLKNSGHETWFFWYVAACCLVTLICVWRMRDTKRYSRIETD